MVKENLYDLALSGIAEIIEAVSTEISKEFTGTNPFDKEPVSDEDALNEFNTSGYEIFSEIANVDGLTKAIEYRDKMLGLKQKKEGR